jgi:hypothetical protein
MGGAFLFLKRRKAMTRPDYNDIDDQERCLAVTLVGKKSGVYGPFRTHAAAMKFIQANWSFTAYSTAGLNFADYRQVASPYTVPVKEIGREEYEALRDPSEAA